ncbi:hypothetical protein [Jiulongibacter sediminis]|uniref:TonB C-terminal domain-containing protein n=1 Tax=Jiulongibacter sediminis TaxID=1605367 RepID=A0A0N8HAB1_9BACT|nr:hypothetical protein [Jiulongibacter sediminis]KPM49676.1 hypothetical protein AFM12_03535 [Jiulongibacter sediminis]
MTTKSFRFQPFRFSVTFIVLTLIIFPSFGQEKYLRWVGDSEFNAETDDPNFSPCGPEAKVLQYFNTNAGPQYAGEKPALIRHFNSNYKAPENNHQSGMVRIRFVVNCEGKAGRFRLLEADENYAPFSFDSSITDQLLRLTREIKNWHILPYGETTTDYYFYLIFKIKDGQIIEILP